MAAAPRATSAHSFLAMSAAERAAVAAEIAGLSAKVANLSARLDRLQAALAGPEEQAGEARVAAAPITRVSTSLATEPSLSLWRCEA
jgi:hypothetical protein